MSVGSALQAVARNLINNVFGNTIEVYSYADATVTHDEEGHETITWGDATEAKAVFTELMPQIISIAPQFEETLGRADMTIPDNTTVAVKDKVVHNSVNYQIDEVDNTARANDALILQAIKLHKMES